MILISLSRRPDTPKHFSTEFLNIVLTASLSASHSISETPLIVELTGMDSKSSDVDVGVGDGRTVG